jgi:uncharacterized membrane protein YkgB
MGNEIVLGVGILVFLLLWFGNSLGKEHGLLKLMITFFGLTFLITIPASLFVTYGSVAGVTTFYKGFMWFYGLLWTYIITYLVYTSLDKFGTFKGGKGK